VRRHHFNSSTSKAHLQSTLTTNTQDDHAVILTQFAKQCRRKANQVLFQLNPKLDTSNLNIRIGIHSGPVTAGVLRGDKARFDLFGDTINTAARIESTGKPNYIHLSEETAQLLELGGNGHWLLPRKDPVKAKGKGLLKTFWLRDDDDHDPRENTIDMV
jgi:class 3 adenylate cyclase